MSTGNDLMNPRYKAKGQFVFWLIRELFSADQVDEEANPIRDREYYMCLTLIGAALIVYASVFRLFAP